jgi:hypothetical protein
MPGVNVPLRDPSAALQAVKASLPFMVAGIVRTAHGWPLLPPALISSLWV